MKELTTEEKAKAYDKVREKIVLRFGLNVAEEIFSEYEETDDERIRKALLEMVHDTTGDSLWIDYNVHKEDALSWLEKQKSEEINVKALLTADKLAAAEMTGRLKERKDIVENPQKYGLEKQGEQKPADKVEPKFNVGDMIIHKELGGDYIHNPHKIIQVDILDKKYRLEGGLVAHFGEQDDYELVKQKPSWSKEDEEKLDRIIRLIHFYIETIQEENELKTFLKSLKDRVQPQNKWKESLATADLENSLCDIQDGFSDTSYEYRILGEAIEFIRCTEPKPQ